MPGGRAATPKRKNNSAIDRTESEHKKSKQKDGVPDNDVNKAKSSQNSTGKGRNAISTMKDDKQKKSLKAEKGKREVKKKKATSAERVKVNKEVFEANVEEDNDIVTYQVEGEDSLFPETEEGELPSEDSGDSDAETETEGEIMEEIMPVIEDVAVALQNNNSSANSARPTLNPMRETEPGQDVRKQIVGETFALVKEMMVESSFFEAANLVKKGMDKMSDGQNQSQNKGKAIDEDKSKNNAPKERGESVTILVPLKQWFM